MKELYDTLERYGIECEEKAFGYVCKKKLETFYITTFVQLEEDLFYVEVYHKNSIPSRNKVHGLVPDSHLQFKGKMSLKKLAQRMKYHRGQGERF